MTSIDVYVPNPDHQGGLQTSGIDPKSAIVGRRMVGHDPESPVLIYYEGNRYGAANIVTFADRCMLAAGRLIDNAPTVATRLVHCDAVIRVAGYLPDHRRVQVDDGLSLARLARWLSDAPADADPTDYITDVDATDLLCSPRPMSAAEARDYMIRRRYAPDDAA